MKIVMPEFVLPLLERRTCEMVESRELLDTCDILLIEELGFTDGDVSTDDRSSDTVAGHEGGEAADIRDVEVVMVPWTLSDGALRRLLSAPALRWAHVMTAGVEHVVRAMRPETPQASAPERNVVITNAAGIFDVPIAEAVLTWILVVAKRIPEFLDQQRAHQWHLLRLRELGDLTVGLIGLGNIGHEIARRCRAMGMRVIATRRHPDRESSFVDEVFTPDRLPELLQASDFVAIAAPLTPQTRGLFGTEAFRQMRPGAWLINVARGPIVDQEALVEALQEGTIGGAALDVFDEEPLPPDSPLWDVPNVMIMPHNSWSSPHFKQREADLFLDNLERYLRGEPLRNVVDLTQGY